MAIAIAILAFVIVSLIGLLSVGISTQKASVDNTRMAAMAQYVITTESLKSYTVVSAAGYSTTYYFDLNANTNTPSASYFKCTVTNIASLGNNPAFMAPNTNFAPMQMTLAYPVSAPVNSNVFYYNRANP